VSHCTAAPRQAPEEVAAWLQCHEPRSVPIDLWRGQLRDFVLPAVLRVAPVGFSSARSTVHALTHLAAWCLAQGTPLTWDAVLDPDTVERYICVGIPDWRREARTGHCSGDSGRSSPPRRRGSRGQRRSPAGMLLLRTPPTNWSCSRGTPSTREHQPGSARTVGSTTSVHLAGKSPGGRNPAAGVDAGRGPRRRNRVVRPASGRAGPGR
jgi:hypothetical protein